MEPSIRTESFDDLKPKLMEMPNEETPILTVNLEDEFGGPSKRPSLDDSPATFVDTRKKIKGWPIGIFFIMLNELCERFSYYGLMAILATYLEVHLRLGESNATVVTHLFKFAAYGTAVLGGYLSDVVMGKFKVIAIFSGVYVVGGLMMAVGAIDSLWVNEPDGVPLPYMTYAALAVVALGTGAIKASVSSFVGDQFLPTEFTKLATVFTIFYFMINSGSLISTFITPILKRISYSVAFGVPAILLVVAMIIFLAGYSLYVINPTGKNMFKLVFNVVRSAWRERKAARARGELFENIAFLDYAKKVIPSPDVEDVRALLRVIYVYVPLPVFWSLFDQHSSKWIFQAKEMNLTLFGDVTIIAEQVQVLNPLLMLIMLPIFDRVVFPLARRCGLPLTPLIHKMVPGFLLTVLSFVVSGIVQTIINQNPPGTVHVAWIIPQFLIMSCGEVLVSVTGLEFSYSQAPKSMKALVMSSWLVAIALGNILVVIISKIPIPNRAIEYFVYAALMFCSVVIFFFMARGFQYKNTREGAEDETDGLIEEKENNA